MFFKIILLLIYLDLFLSIKTRDFKILYNLCLFELPYKKLSFTFLVEKIIITIELDKMLS